MHPFLSPLYFPLDKLEAEISIQPDKKRVGVFRPGFQFPVSPNLEQLRRRMWGLTTFLVCLIAVPTFGCSIDEHVSWDRAMGHLVHFLFCPSESNRMRLESSGRDS